MYYTIAGRKVASHHLSMFVLGTAFLGPIVYKKVFGSSTNNMANNGVPEFDAASEEEKQFVLKYLKDKL